MVKQDVFLADKNESFGPLYPRNSAGIIYYGRQIISTPFDGILLIQIVLYGS